MKEIRKIFNINRRKNKEKGTFTTIEVVIISFSLAVITGVVSGYLVYSFNSSKMDSKEVADIISTFEHITDDTMKKSTMASLLMLLSMECFRI